MSKSNFKKVVRKIKNREARDLKRSKLFYKLGKYLKKGYKTNEISRDTKMAARRTYKFFKGSILTPTPSPTELKTMNKERFEEFLQQELILRRESSLFRGRVLTSAENDLLPSYVPKSPAIPVTIEKQEPTLLKHLLDDPEFDMQKYHGLISYLDK